MAKKGQPLVLWPAYFDARRSREEGRVLLKADYVKGSVVAKVAEKLKAQRS